MIISSSSFPFSFLLTKLIFYLIFNPSDDIIIFFTPSSIDTLPMSAFITNQWDWKIEKKEFKLKKEREREKENHDDSNNFHMIAHLIKFKTHPTPNPNESHPIFTSPSSIHKYIYINIIKVSPSFFSSNQLLYHPVTLTHSPTSSSLIALHFASLIINYYRLGRNRFLKKKEKKD